MNMNKKNVVILGSTGSIGKSALDLFDGPLKKEYRVLALSAGSDAETLKKQAKKYRPKYLCIADETKAGSLKDCGAKVLTGMEGLCTLASLKEADTVLLSVVGAAGIIPLLYAVRAGKRVALANKESLVIAGDIVMSEAKKYGAQILPVDSEHNAVFQALMGNEKKSVKKLLITASGGPFRNLPREKLKNITAQHALKHPTWKMGRKITIDSATLMNKGLEVIEAHYLFGMPYEKIEVVIHPQSIVHSLVEYTDCSVMAQMSNPDMRLPIMFALTYPERKQGVIKPLNLSEKGTLEFGPVDFKKFPAFSLALKAGKTGGTMPACMNAANEEAVAAFLKNDITFNMIPELIEKMMKVHVLIKKPSLEDILRADSQARENTRRIIYG